MINRLSYLKVTEVVLLQGQQKGVEELRVVAPFGCLAESVLDITRSADSFTKESDLCVVERIVMLHAPVRKLHNFYNICF